MTLQFRAVLGLKPQHEREEGLAVHLTEASRHRAPVAEDLNDVFRLNHFPVHPIQHEIILAIG